MYRKIEGNLRMPLSEVRRKYIDEFVLVREDPGRFRDPMCTVLYVGDNDNEVSNLRYELENYENCVVIECLNPNRIYLDGVVVGA